MDFRKIADTNRVSIKRAVARFCYLRNIPLSEEEFFTLVRKTQDSGYRSAIRFLSRYFSHYPPKKRRQLLYQFTIEYNTEMVYCRQFPEGNKTMKEFLAGVRTPEQKRFFKDVLYSIVKANPLQQQIIDQYV